MEQTDRPAPEVPIGIRVSGAVADAVGPHDQTEHGVYWFDLATRRPLGARLKRGFDVVGAAVLLVVLSPVLALAALAVAVGSRGPVLFRQRRIGFRCQEFGMLKFRTMIVGAESSESELAEDGRRAFFKLRTDPRVTPVGRLLRRFSLDELPQLVNVLEGSMSLVGPRPLLLSDLGKFPLRGQMRRFSVRPGITGLWQVSGRSDTSDEERLELDRRYVNEWSLWLDLRILARTVGAVLSGRGAA